METELYERGGKLYEESNGEAGELRCFRDPIWDLLKFNRFVCSFIDTPQFQRLRYLKQLGTSYFVFPGASHNRFEHSLGTAHLSRKLVELLKERQPNLNIDNRDVQCIELAGLCHDLGHGPFSHVFDNHVVPRIRPDRKNWCHEEASEMMLDSLIQENKIDIPQDWVDFIKDLIRGEPRRSLHHNPPEKQFLFEIVSNKANGIDVDKWDYLARDSKMVGVSCTLVTSRLLEAARVVDGRVAYNWKDSQSIHELFYARYSLHKRVYNHKVARAIEYMIVEALLAAEPVYQIGQKIDDPKEYLHLTDSILEEIERSRDPRLKEAQAVILNLRKRIIPHRVEEKCVAVEYKRLWKEELTPAAVLAAAKELMKQGDTLVEEVLVEANKGKRGLRSSPRKKSGSRKRVSGNVTPKTKAPLLEGSEGNGEDVPLTEHDIIIDFSVLHFGMKDKDPLELVSCYGKNNPDHCSFIRPDEFGSLRPRSFQELVVRCYARNKSQRHIVQAAFRKVMENLPTEQPEEEVSTPTPTVVPSSPLQRGLSFSDLAELPVASTVKKSSNLPKLSPQSSRTGFTPFATASNSFMSFSLDIKSPVAGDSTAKRKGDEEVNSCGSPQRKKLRK